MKPLHPMIPFLTAWLAQSIHLGADRCLSVVNVVPESPSKIRVEFASGPTLYVEVSEVDPSK